MNYLEGKTLAEKQMHYYNGYKCPYCDGLSELVESDVVYGEGRNYGLMYYCAPCQAHVGTHPGTDQALGPLAKKALRDLRHETHKYFDPMWQKKIEQGFDKKAARRAAYGWLGKILELTPQEAHVGYLDNDQCRKVIAECKKYMSGTPENLSYKETYQPTKEELANIEMLDLAGGIFFDVRPVSDAKVQLLSHIDESVFTFDARTNMGKWGNEKWKKVDIEKIIKGFKIKLDRHGKQSAGSKTSITTNK